MCDPFAAALGASSADDAEVVDVDEPVGTLPAGYTSPAGKLAIAASAHCASAAMGSGSHGLTANARARNARKRNAPAKASSQCPKRRVEGGPVLTEITDKPVAISCVFAPVEGPDDQARAVPVPLWPQYHARWRNDAVIDTAFLVVCNYERWFNQLVYTIAKDSCVRKTAKSFLDHFKEEFRVAMGVTRKQRSPGLKNPFEDTLSDDEHGDDDSQGSRAPKTRDGLVSLVFAGHTIFCLNHLGHGNIRMVLQMDDAAGRFLSAWLVPTLVHFACKARAALQKPVAVPSTAVGPEDSPGFHMGVSSTPNIRGKVLWVPSDHKWKLVVKKPTGADPGLSAKVRVDSALQGTAYEDAKRAAYWRAVLAWNQLDGSKRHRIPLRDEHGAADAAQ